MQAEEKFKWLSAEQAFISVQHEVDKIIAFDRAGVIFVLNFHPTKSVADYIIGAPEPGKYKLWLDSDRQSTFGGWDRIQSDSVYFTEPTPCGRAQSLKVYLPSRVALILIKDE